MSSNKALTHDSPKVFESILSLVNKKIQQNKAFFSVELCPDSTVSCATLLNNSLSDLNILKETPLFVSVACPFKGSPSSDNVGAKTRKTAAAVGGIQPLLPTTELAYEIQKTYGIPALLHMTARTLSFSEAYNVLNNAKELGIRNILALRGDANLKGDFPYAVDLVRFIRSKFGDYFTIAVAGYPCGHHEASSLTDDLLHLKEKIQAGADFIITQIIFNVDEFRQFIAKCREIGILSIIIPGVFLFESYKSLSQMTKFCKVKMLELIDSQLKILQINKEEERKLCVQFTSDLVSQLLQTDFCPGIHFFNINRVSCVLGFCQHIKIAEKPLKIRHNDVKL